MDLLTLKKQYRQMLENDSTQEGSDAAWKWFTCERYKLEPSKKIIFRILMDGPKEAGMDLYYDYILDNITIKKYYAFLIANVSKPYVASLINVGLAESCDMVNTYLKTALVIVKGTDSIGKLPAIPPRDDPEQQELSDLIDEVGSIVWYNLIEQIHFKLCLPSVQAIKPFLHIDLEKEIEVLESNDFSRFELTPEEVQYYKDLIGL